MNEITKSLCSLYVHVSKVRRPNCYADEFDLSLYMCLYSLGFSSHYNRIDPIVREHIWSSITPVNTVKYLYYCFNFSIETPHRYAIPSWW